MIHVFLICLACCCSSLMPLKQSDSIVSEDHTQVVERKRKNNYYAERQYQVIYSISMLSSDNYWLNLKNDMVNNPSNVMLGGTTTISYYDFLNSSVVWHASSTTLSSIYIYAAYNGNLVQISQNVLSIEDLTLYTSSKYNTRDTINLRFEIKKHSDNTTFVLLYSAFYDDSNSLNFIGCSVSYNNNFYNTFDATSCFAFPKGNCVLSVSGVQSLDYDDGYYNGYNNGFTEGRNSVQAEANQEEYMRGYTAGEQDGYAEGIAYSQEQSSTALTIFTGILEVGLLPVNVFLQMFNYEVFGINIAGFISGLITIAMVMIFVRFIFGGKDNGK